MDAFYNLINKFCQQGEHLTTFCDLYFGNICLKCKFLYPVKSGKKLSIEDCAELGFNRYDIYISCENLDSEIANMKTHDFINVSIAMTSLSLLREIDTSHMLDCATKYKEIDDTPEIILAFNKCTLQLPQDVKSEIFSANIHEPVYSISANNGTEKLYICDKLEHEKKAILNVMIYTEINDNLLIIKYDHNFKYSEDYVCGYCETSNCKIVNRVSIKYGGGINFCANTVVENMNSIFSNIAMYSRNHVESVIFNNDNNSGVNRKKGESLFDD